MEKKLETIKNALEDKKAGGISIIDISQLSAISDYIIIADAANANQLDAMIDSVYDSLAAEFGIHPKAIEGNKNSRWVLMDYVDFIVNLFTKDQRVFYDLDKIWSDGKKLT
jgi:ribosome-associated protein